MLHLIILCLGMYSIDLLFNFLSNTSLIQIIELYFLLFVLLHQNHLRAITLSKLSGLYEFILLLEFHISFKILFSVFNTSLYLFLSDILSNSLTHPVIYFSCSFGTSTFKCSFIFLTASSADSCDNLSIFFAVILSSPILYSPRTLGIFANLNL